MNGVVKTAIYAVSIGLLLFLMSCGGSSNSSNTGSTNNGGSINTGGSNSGNTGGSGSGSGGSGAGTSTSTTYIYAGTAMDAGGILSYKLDASSGKLTQLSSVTLPGGSNTGGSVLATSGYVYTFNRTGDSQPGAIYSYKVDPNTGALSSAGSPVDITPVSDPNIRFARLSPDGKTAYLMSQFGVYAVSLNNGNPKLLGSQTLSTADVWGFTTAGHFAYAGIQDGSPKEGFSAPVIKEMSINSDGSFGTPQPIATLSDANIPYDLTSDAAGKFVAATTGMNNNSVAMFSVNSTTGALTAVAGSPFNVGAQVGKKLAFDPSGTHLYYVDNPDYDPRQESIMVFDVASNGALNHTQTLDLGTGESVIDLKVEADFAYISNLTGSVQSNILVLRRDSSSGQLSVASNTAVGTSVGTLGIVHF